MAYLTRLSWLEYITELIHKDAKSTVRNNVRRTELASLDRGDKMDILVDAVKTFEPISIPIAKVREYEKPDECSMMEWMPNLPDMGRMAVCPECDEEALIIDGDYICLNCRIG